MLGSVCGFTAFEFAGRMAAKLRLTPANSAAALRMS